jgi:ferredoxin
VSQLSLLWPNGLVSHAQVGTSWLEAAQQAGCPIPTGCLGGSCGACEIAVNGETLRACISCVEGSQGITLEIDLGNDPYW